MRKTLIASAMALALSSTSAFAAVDGVAGGASAGASISSAAIAVSKGNGGAIVSTGGHQVGAAKYEGSSYSSYSRQRGSVEIAGAAKAGGAAGVEVKTWGKGFGAAGTAGRSSGESGGAGFFDTHGYNPEGVAAGGAHAHNVNMAGAIGAGPSYSLYGNRSGTMATYHARAAGNRDGGSWKNKKGFHEVSTAANTSSISTDVGGGFTLGFGIGGEFSNTAGGSVAGAHAKSGKVQSTN